MKNGINMRFFYILFGISFTAFGAIFFAISVASYGRNDYPLASLLAGTLFFGIGLIFSVLYIRDAIATKKVFREGKKYRCKIYAYHTDNSALINGEPLLVVEVRYFDEAGYEQRTMCETQGVAGQHYPIGATATVSVYGQQARLDLNSISNEPLYAEELLMDDKPLGEPVHLVATTCKSCGASLYEAEGFIYRCPYCSSYGNMEYKDGSLQQYEKKNTAKSA